ncbi:hypothetical protein ACP70R_032577 [Stipagrostis hirtigluma subsp. patula]
MTTPGNPGAARGSGAAAARPRCGDGPRAPPPQTATRRRRAARRRRRISGPSLHSAARCSGLRSSRSPRSWDSRRLGLDGLVDTLAEPAADAKNGLLGPQMRPPASLQAAAVRHSAPRDCASVPLELKNALGGCCGGRVVGGA